MELTSPLITRIICAGLVMALVTPPAAKAGDEKQDAPAVQQSQAAQTSSPPADGGPTSATGESQTAQTTPDQLPDSPDAVRSQASDQNKPSTAPQSSSQEPPKGQTQKPVGTAAAEVQNSTGDAAFKPAGAAIAPAKQGRKRMILIKVGALVGAGVALGSVAALSSASPSRPPGSH